MNRHRKASAFPDIGTPGDPRLLAAIERRTPGVAGGGINHFFGGTVITPPKKSKRGAAASVKPLTLVSSRPAYVPAGSAVASGHVSTWITWGFCNGKLPTNWSDRIDSVASGDYTKYFYLKCNMVTTGAQLVLSSCSWEAYDSESLPEDSPWGADGSRPAIAYLLLGTLHVATDSETGGVSVSLANSGTGSIQLIEYLSGITQNGASGFAYTKALAHSRLI